MGKMIGFFMFIFLLTGALTAFYTNNQGGVTTTLASALSNTETTQIVVAATGGYAPASVVVVEKEIIRYASIGTCSGSPCFLTLTRGLDNTVVDAHASGARVYDAVLGYAQLGLQNQAAVSQNELENQVQVSWDPRSWKAMVDRLVTANNQLLTGNWKLALLPWYAFSVVLLVIVAVGTAGLIRTLLFR